MTSTDSISGRFCLLSHDSNEESFWIFLKAIIEKRTEWRPVVELILVTQNYTGIYLDKNGRDAGNSLPIIKESVSYKKSILIPGFACTIVFLIFYHITHIWINVINTVFHLICYYMLFTWLLVFDRVDTNFFMGGEWTTRHRQSSQRTKFD